MEIKLAHCADIHLGAECKCLGALSDIRRSEIKCSFFKMIEKINLENVDLLLVSGDLFHDVNIPSSDVKEVKSAFSGLKGKVVIAPGNHDPFTPDSPYYETWPQNVYIFKSSEITSFELKELNTRVFGGAFIQGNGFQTKLSKNIGIDNNFLNILVAHGTISQDKSNIYNPISLEDIRNSGMHYVALGHIHKRTPVLRQGNTYYSYPGCLEGRNFGELGEKGFYLGTISDRLCDLGFIRMSKRICSEVYVDVTNLDSSLDIISSTICKIKETFKDEYKDNIYRIILSGTVPEEPFIDTNYIEKSILEEVFFAKVFDETELIPSLSGQSLKSIFFRKVNEQIDNYDNEEDKKVLRRALKLGILSFSREVKYSDN